MRFFDFAMGFVVYALAQFLWERWSARKPPQRRVRQRDYFNACGDGCTIGTEAGRG